MTVCIQCSLEAMAAGKPLPGPFNESPEEHLKRVHPDGVKPEARRELEKTLERMFREGRLS